MTRDTILDTSRSRLSRPVEELELELENPTLFCPLSSSLLLVDVSPRPRLLLSNTPV